MCASVRVTQRVSSWVHLWSMHLSKTFKAPDSAVGAIGDLKMKDSIFNPKDSIQ